MKFAKPITGKASAHIVGGEETLANAACLPIQYRARSEIPRTLSSRLWLAVVEQGLRDACDNNARIRESALAWLASPSEAVGSFRWIMLHMGQNPDCAARLVHKRLKNGNLQAINRSR